MRDTPRPFLLDRLLVPEAIASMRPSRSEKPEENFARAKWKARIDRLLGKAGLPKLAPSPNEYREPHFHYDPAFEALGPRTSLFGYFQSERYFNSIAGNLRDWFSPREPLGDAAAAALKRIEASRLPVSVHVRRGDYLKPGTHEVHGIFGEPYYREVFDRLEGTIGQRSGAFHIFGRSRGGGASAEFCSGLTLESCLRRSGASLGRHGADGALPASCDCQQLFQLVGRVVESVRPTRSSSRRAPGSRRRN